MGNKNMRFIIPTIPRKDKRGLELKLAFFAVIAVGMIILSTQIILDEWETAYGEDIPYDLGEYNELDTMSQQAGQQQGNMSVTDPGSSTDFEGTTLRGVFGILNTIFTPFRVVFGNDGMVASITDRFGLPDWVRQGIVTMMVVALTMSLIAIFFRLPRRSA